MRYPTFNSEREGAHYWPDGRYDDSHWEDCAWNSLGMARDVATGGATAPSHTEMERIRGLVMGPLLGTTAQQLMAGARAAWGWVPKVIPYNATWSTVWASVPIGGAFVLMGRLSMFPDGHRLRRFQPTYTGGHAICGVKEDETGGRGFDPLGPLTGYAGERWTAAEFATFYGGLRGGGADTIVTPPAVAVAAQGVEMYPIVYVRPLAAPNPRQFTVKKGAIVIGYDPATPNVRYAETTFAADSSAHVDAEIAVDWRNFGAVRPVPDSGGGWGFWRVVDGTYAGKLIVAGLKLPDGSPALILEPPTPVAAGGITQAQVDALVEQAKTVTRAAVKDRSLLEVDGARSRIAAL
jgi:hypothetical protein